MRSHILLLIAALLACGTREAAAQDRRVAPVAGGSRRLALVIGNNAYPWKPLANAVNDAKALAALLPLVGFQPGDVTLVTDTSLRQLQRAAREFLEKLKPDDMALVYYSGHGIEVRGENFLIPVDFPANASELEVQDDAYSAQQLLRNLEATQARVRLMILDACRDNPLRAKRSGAGGLGRMEGQGTLIVFATGVGQTADDNPNGANGLFTSRLLRALPTPGVPVDQLVKQVARQVYQDSRQRQTPAIYGMLLEDFEFVPGTAPAASATIPPVRAPDAEAWETIRASGDRALFEQFLKEYPTSQYAGAARLKLAAMRPEAPAATAPPPKPPAGRFAALLAEGFSTPASTAPPPRPPAVPAPSSVTAPARLAQGMTKVNPKDGLTYVWIPPGRFQMGCSPGDSGCYDGEKPAHEVTITKGFWLGRTPVTQQGYQHVTGQNPSDFKGANLPVEMVSWDESRAYCAAIGGRLPTEAEWEYAARAGTMGARYGNLDEIAWYEGNSGGRTHEVGQKQANAFGLYDMLGNVWQWVEDWYGNYESGSQRDPYGPSSGQGRTQRGVSWGGVPRVVRVSFRGGAVPGVRLNSMGLRCAGE